jgi:hypothetical protein
VLSRASEARERVPGSGARALSVRRERILIVIYATLMAAHTDKEVATVN